MGTYCLLIYKSKEVIKIRLIVNADDFGYSKGVNLGILEAFENGILTSTTLMTNMPGTEHAFSLMRKYKDLLHVGVHLTLGIGKPVRDDVHSLIDENGNFYKIKELPKYAELKDIEKEFYAQVEKFLSFGFKPTHIDSHYHIHKTKEVLQIVLKIADEYNLPVRIFDKKVLLNSRYKHIKSNDYFIDEFKRENTTPEFFEKLIIKSLNYDVVEMMCHPGYVDQVVLDNSSYNIHRAKDLSAITNPIMKDIIKKYNIKLINYGDL